MPFDRLATARRNRSASLSHPHSADLGGQPAPGRRWRFWATAYALLILLTGTNLPTP